MLPTITQSDDVIFERHVNNVIAAHNALSSDQVMRGTAWYPAAHDLALIIGAGDIRKGAGIIAALSPQKAWEINQALAHDAAAGNVHGQTRDNLAKVAAILAGADPTSVLPMDRKTGNFYLNIFDLDDAEAVTIDRHAARIIDPDDPTADKGLGAAGRYAYAAHVYREAARRLGILPAVLQARVWIGRVDTHRWARVH